MTPTSRRSPVLAAGRTPRQERAAIAVGHSILVAAYHILDRRQPYHDLGVDWFLKRYPTHNHVRRLVAQLERLGHTVTLEPATAA